MNEMVDSRSRTSNGSKLCHVVICNDQVTRIMAVWIGSGWILPLAVLPHNQQIERVYYDTLAELGGEESRGCRFIHCARFEHPRRVSEIHAYCLVLKETTDASTDDRRWRDMGELLSSRPILPEQLVALRLAVERLTRPAATFDSWPASRDMEQWVRRVLMDKEGTDLREIVWRRRSRNDAVGTCYTSKGTRVFLKAGPHRANEEARLADVLNSHMPGAAPTTIALNSERAWWLVADASGWRVPPSARNGELYAEAVRQCSALQRSLSQDSAAVATLAVRRTDEEALTHLIPLVTQWGIDSGAFAARQLEPEYVARTLGEAVERLADLQAPTTWVHFDLSFENILAMPNGVLCFIDLEYGSLGHPLLSFGMLLREARRRGTSAAQACEETILAEWARFGRDRWRRSCRDLPILRCLLTIAIMRLRFADYAGESHSVVSSLYGSTFAALTWNVASLVARLRSS